MNAKSCDHISGGGSILLDALEVGYAIKDARSGLGLTQAQLADAAGISKRCLWSLELGQNPGVQMDKLLAVLEVLGLDLRIVAREKPSNGAGEGKAETGPAPSEKISDFDVLSILTGGRDDVA